MSQPGLSEGPARVGRWPRRASDSGVQACGHRSATVGRPLCRPAAPGASSRRSSGRRRPGRGRSTHAVAPLLAAGRPSTLPGPRPGFPTSIASWAAGSSRGRSCCSPGRPASASPPCCCSGSSSMAGGRLLRPARVSGEESRAQVAARARRLGVPVDVVAFAPGRDLHAVLAAARATRARRARGRFRPDAPRRRGDDAARRGRPGPGVHRRPGRAGEGGGHRRPAGRSRDEGRRSGGPASARARGRRRPDVRGRPALGAPDRVRGARTGSAPRGRPRGSRWGPTGLALDRSRRTAVLRASATRARRSPSRWRAAERSPSRSRPWSGAATAPAAGRSPASTFGGSSRSRRSSSVTQGCRSGAPSCSARSPGGIRVDDPASDLAVAAALVSAATGVAPPAGAAFVGEIALTGQVRAAPGMEQRVSAARAAGCSDALRPRGSLDGPRGPSGGHRGSCGRSPRLGPLTCGNASAAAERRRPFRPSVGRESAL